MLNRLDCHECSLFPCACKHIANLRPGSRLAHLREAALLEVNKPLSIGPDGQPTYHRGGCPCPRCYSLCAATYLESEH